MKWHRVLDLNIGKVIYIRFQKDLAEHIGKSRQAIWKQVKKKGFYKDKNFKVEIIEVL